MRAAKISIIFWMASVLMIGGAFRVALAGPGKQRYEKFLSDREAGEKRKRHRRQYRHGDDHDRKQHLIPARNSIHTEACGACHLPYPPDLLPARSWAKILAERENHFGETVNFDSDYEKNISDYLRANSADRFRTELAVKVMRSLGAGVPARITEVPYIRAKHRKIGADVLKRETIGSLSNCKACHMSAESWIFRDDRVRIPR